VGNALRRKLLSRFNEDARRLRQLSDFCLRGAATLRTNDFRLRSSELWEDGDYTFVVEQFCLLDLILFNRARRAFGAHVGVFVGENNVLHLSRRVGVPAVWRLHEFAEIASYRVLVGGKRTRK